MKHHTEGVLCRDASPVGSLRFFIRASRADLVLASKRPGIRHWRRIGEVSDEPYKVLNPDQWKAVYDMPVPHRGKAVEIWLEL